jgi:hypothetical protein
LTTWLLGGVFSLGERSMTGGAGFVERRIA